MAEIQRPLLSDSTLLFGGGALCFICGLFMLAERSAVAAFFLSADFLFGLPLTSSDAFKVLFVELGGLAAIGMGIILFVVGRFVYSKAKASMPQGAAATPTNG
jgi:hypothetical protein